VSSWASRQHAGGSPGITAAAATSDKGGITPAANTIVVNSTADAANSSDGLCTLREAITAANGNVASGVVGGECAAGSTGGTDTVDLTGVTGTINLTGALPDITSNMTGPGSSRWWLTIKTSTTLSSTALSYWRNTSAT